MRRNPAVRLLAVAVVIAAGATVHASSVTITPDRIQLHDEFIPRFTNLPRVLIVPAGQTVTLPPDSTWDAIEVAGTLRVSRSHDTTCRFVHLVILPGGTLDAGRVDDPVLKQVEFIVRDVPVDTTRDPYQWGNGLLNFGHQSRVGRQVAQVWTELQVDAEAGATTLRFAVPEGWSVGDELLLPDLRQINGKRAPIRRESPVTIEAIEGDVVTLSKPLDFEHRAITDPDGKVVVRPRVANLTRNIVIRSENPLGTPGHTLNAGDATWDIRYNRLIGLGRTRAEKLDSTTANPDTGAILHVGTNQIARYASHDHHVGGHGGDHSAHHGSRYFFGNVLEGAGPGKWGHVVHGTHDTHVEENIAVGFAGAGFVTEDGYEVRNVFRRNVASYTSGNGIDALGNLHLRSGRNCPGCEGSGFWFRGVHQTIDQNESWNNAIGINLFAMHQVAGMKVPREPGSSDQVTFDPGQAVPVTFSDNVALSNAETGHEQWGTARFSVVRVLAAHNGQAQVRAAQSRINMWLQAPVLVAQGGLSYGISSSEAYVGSLEVDGGRIVGCGSALIRGGAHRVLHLRNLTLQCVTNINFTGVGFADESIYENLTHRQYGSHPPRYMVLGRERPWQPGEKLAGLPARTWTPAQGTRHIVKNWQGTGRDYRLYEQQQLASAPAWPATGAYGTDFYCPEQGLTMGECWERYGLAYGGGTVSNGEAVALEGLVNGVAASGLDTPLGTPRAVLTTPNMMSAAKVRKGNRGVQVRLQIVLTGDPARANRVAVVQIDDKRPMRCAERAGGLNGDASCDSDVTAEGQHTVRTWREDRSARKIPESELVFRYYVGTEPAEAQPRGTMSRRTDR